MTPINTPVIHQQYPIPISVVLGYLSIITLCVTSLALPLPPRTLKFINRSIILPLIILVCVYIYRTCCMHIEDSPGHRFGMPSHAIGLTLRAIDTLLFSGDPHKTLFRTSSPTPPRTFTERLKYSIAFWSTFRGINWNWESRKTPKAVNTTKMNFLTAHMTNIIWRYLLMDSIDAFLRTAGFFTVPPRLMGEMSLGTPLRHLAGLAHGVHLWQLIEMSYSSMVIPCVLLNLSTTKECPPQFGSISQATTIATYWSTLWHGNWKKAFVGVSLGIVRFLRLPTIFGMIVTFVVSGLFHSLLTLSLHRGDFSTGAGKGALISFSIQPIGIILEKVFQAKILPLIPSYITQSRAFKSLSYVWVILWLSNTSIYAFDEVNQAGLFTKPLLPFSPISLVLNKI